MDLTDMIFNYTKSLPQTERFNLIQQMNRCSCSIPSNIAEGSGKTTNRHFAEFLSVALSSSYELQTQLLLCQRRKYGSDKELNTCLESAVEIQKMIYSFRERIRNQT